jgi:hypothetical protein
MLRNFVPVLGYRYIDRSGGWRPGRAGRDVEAQPCRLRTAVVRALDGPERRVTAYEYSPERKTKPLAIAFPEFMAW